MLNDKFMLDGEAAEYLYNSFAKNAPIFDYHCHLSAKEIYEDEVFSDIASLWLGHDHYKWRALRYAGAQEEYVSSGEDGLQKFRIWARTCERMVGSPLYHWSNLELKTCFGVDEYLHEETAERIYGLCNHRIKELKLSPVKIIRDFNVKLICTTDDPTDNLKYHGLLKQEKYKDFLVLPTFRPDKAISINNDTFITYMGLLSEAANITITNYSDLLAGLKQRLEYFCQHGCLLTDHSIEKLSYAAADRGEVEKIFDKRMTGVKVSAEEEYKYMTHTLEFLASEYRKAGLVMQLHIGAMRNTNQSMFERLGPDAGFDIMNDFSLAQPLSGLLDAMDREGGLPKTIIYNLNSKDNQLLASIPHCFPEAGKAGKVQFGPAWWFNDHKEGIIAHFKELATQGMLAYFVGMVTDSRSFLSYVRHDYFRRILCTFVGKLVDTREFERNEKILKEIIEGVSFKNIQKYLGLE